ncbi:methyltransferase [Streptomyces sp. NPDC048297]|uniref:methyltransferase n=1 Tax=Streptomyces sp. NPDC048297 TaxID=3365531 RepID=UPI0037233681
MTHAQTTDSALSPAPLMELAGAFWGFKTFAAAVELNLFSLLADGRRMSLKEIAAELGIHERPADMFLAGCASLGLLDKEGDAYGNTPISEEFLVVGRPRYFGGFVRYCDQREYPAWHRVIDAMRTNAPLTWDPRTQDSVFAAEDPVMLELFWEAMFSLSAYTAAKLADVVDFHQHRRLLDVGGGSAAFPIGLSKYYPHLTATVFDLPHVRPIAEEKISKAGRSEAISFVAGDFVADPELPRGHDVILLSSILHDWDEHTGRQLLSKCYEALEPGGQIVICELLLNPERTGPASAALMGLNMVVETAGGKNYAEDEYLSWLAEAGFTDGRVIHFEAAGANGAVIARK